jgi:hypothetical protein
LKSNKTAAAAILIVFMRRPVHFDTTVPEFRHQAKSQI